MKKIFSILILCFVTMLSGCGKKEGFTFDQSKEYDTVFTRWDDEKKEKVYLNPGENKTNTLSVMFLSLLDLKPGKEQVGPRGEYEASFTQGNVELYVAVISHNSDGTSWMVFISEVVNKETKNFFKTDLVAEKNGVISGIYELLINVDQN